MASDSRPRTRARARTRRCLRALATGSEDSDRDALAEAERALAGVRPSVEFLADGGDRRLRAAVAAAVREGDRERVVRGRAALRALRSLQRAAAGDERDTNPDTLLADDQATDTLLADARTTE